MTVSVDLLDDAIFDVDVGVEGLVIVHDVAVLDKDARLGTLDKKHTKDK